MDFESMENMDAFAEGFGGETEFGEEFGEIEDLGTDTTGLEDMTTEDLLGEDTTEPDEPNGEDGQDIAKAVGVEDTTEANAADEADTTAEDSANPKNTEDKSNDTVYTLKICGEEKKLSLPEVLALAQKGGDYDRVRRGWDEAKADVHRLREIAGARGKSTGELLDELAKAGRAARTEELARRLGAGGLDDDTAGLLAELLVDKTPNAEETEAEAEEADDEAEAEARTAAAREAALGESIKKLVEVYGVSELPEEVIRLSVDKGLMPFEAYQAWKIAEGAKEQEELRRKLAAEQKNRSNKAKGVGSLKGAGEDKRDAFLAGFGL